MATTWDSSTDAWDYGWVIDGTLDLGRYWYDRRPIAEIQLTSADPTHIRQESTETTAVYDGSATDGTNWQNVNGWHNNGPNWPGWGMGAGWGSAGASTRRFAFQNDILTSWVGTTITNALAANCQGIVIWDVTGVGRNSFLPNMNEESYLGDPRFLDPVGAGLTVSSSSYYPYVNPSSLLATQGCAPEISPIVDTIFANIRNAGLLCGVALRAEKVVLDSTHTYFQGNSATFPTDDSTGQNFYGTVSDQLADLDAKLSYAKARWGCRIFYVDSNAPSNDVTNALAATPLPRFAPAYVYSQLRLRHPDCLIMPEETFSPFHTGVFVDGGLAGGININDPAYQYSRVSCRYTKIEAPTNNWPFIGGAELSAVPSSFALIDVSNSATVDGGGNVNGIDSSQFPGGTFSGNAQLAAAMASAIQLRQCILMGRGWTGNDLQLIQWLLAQSGMSGF